MLVEKPEAVRHENATGNASAIYGVDAHPSKQLFATAGGDGSVKIWSLASTPDGEGIAAFELLATLSFHEQAVNCVRWAAHGRFLASGSDDQLVLLYELKPGAPPPVAFGSNATPNKQNWTRSAMLQRHTMTVQDLAWSPDDRLLATCSIDNTICIWDVDPASFTPVMTTPLQTLAGHNGWVKGVAWDPVGKYLTSAGEDKTVRVWRVDNWQETAQVIAEPFENCASTSHFRRLSWSPDGSVVCATHGFKSKKNIAALLNRTTWTNDVDFVGHQGVVTCARFNPKLFGKSDKDEYACCAVGDDDATISIWLAHMARPLTVLKGCFDAAVTDITWLVDTSEDRAALLIASSLDGTICCFQLEPQEIGAPVSDVRLSKILQTKYGSRAGITLASTFVENPLQLQLEAKSARKAGAVAANGSANTLVPKKKRIALSSTTTVSPAAQSTATPGTVNILQAVSKKGDKKRIAPVLLTQSGAPETTPVESTSRVQPNAASVANKIQNILGPTVPDSLGDTSLLDERMTAKPSSPTMDSSEAAAPSTDSLSIATHQSAAKADAKRQRELSLKRKRDGERGTSAGAAIMAKAKEVTPRPAKVLTAASAKGGEVPTEPLLPTSPFRLSFSVEIDVTTVAIPTPATTKQAVIDVNVHNVTGATAAEATEQVPVYSTVRCTEDNTVKWVDRFAGRVVSVAGNATLCAVATATGDLFVLSASGRRLFPCIALGGAPAVVECSPRKSPFLMVVLTSGATKIWNVTTRKLQLNDSVEAIVTSVYSSSQSVTLLRSSLSLVGQPTITFAVSSSETRASASLHSYTFDSDMQSWMRVADDSFVYSDFHSSLSTDAVVAREIPMGPLRRLQNASGFSRTQRGVASAMLKDMPDPLTQRSVTRAHLEHQIATAVILQSGNEYQYWLKAYVRFLTADEDVFRLEELCAELLGPFNRWSRAVGGVSAWTDDILGSSKRGLLRTLVLPVMATNRMLQRVVAKFQLMLSEVDARETSGIVDSVSATTAIENGNGDAEQKEDEETAER